MPSQLYSPKSVRWHHLYLVSRSIHQVLAWRFAA